MRAKPLYENKELMRILAWDEFDRCIERITHLCRKQKFCGVYGFPRGGLCLAVALSHSLNIPLLKKYKTGCLVVDDVYETGRTLREVEGISTITTYVWLSKVQPDWWNAVEISDATEWLVFPWENIEFAKIDEKAYQISRKLPE